MKRIIAAMSLAMLAACMQEPSVVLPADVSMIRNPTAPVGSQVDVVVADLDGIWMPRLTIQGEWPMGGRPVRFTEQNGDLAILTELNACNTDGECATTTWSVQYRQTIAGRFERVAGQDAQTIAHPNEIWIYWFDFDRRTVALGDPNGSYVAILDRSARGGQDRITAAKDILTWYGYDVARLEEVSR